MSDDNETSRDLHADVIPSTCHEALRIIRGPTMRWSECKSSAWVTKKGFFRLVGQSYKSFDDGQSLFWTHLRVLADFGYLPSFSSREMNGRRMCYNKELGLISDIWCKSCESMRSSSASSCPNCLVVIRFKRLQKGQKLKMHLLNGKRFNTVKIAPMSSSQMVAASKIVPTSFKGEMFTKHILPRVLGFQSLDTTTDRKCVLPSNMLALVHDMQTNSTMAKIDALLCMIYDKVVTQHFWIAPTQTSNARISLAKQVKLTSNDCIGLEDGSYHVWGFNAADVYKWHTLQPGDHVLFGNSEDGFNYFATVGTKFLWKNNAECNVFDYFSKHKSWLYGYTVNLQRGKILLPACQVRDIIGGYYQSQCRLSPDKATQLLLLIKGHACTSIQ